MSIISLDPITFPLEHVGLCSQRGEANLVELTHELAYLTIRESPLFEELSNSEWDQKAEALAVHINTAINEWFDAPEVARLKAINDQYAHLDETRRA